MTEPTLESEVIRLCEEHSVHEIVSAIIQHVGPSALSSIQVAMDEFLDDDPEPF